MKTKLTMAIGTLLIAVWSEQMYEYFREQSHGNGFWVVLAWFMVSIIIFESSVQLAGVFKQQEHDERYTLRNQRFRD